MLVTPECTQSDSPVTISSWKLKFALGVVSVIVLCVMAAFFPTVQWQRWQLKRQIQKLGCAKFETQRSAQARIIRAGTTALPELLAALANTKDEKQKALVCYLVGAIDPKSYKDVLVSSNSSQNACAFSKYLNRDAIANLRSEDRDVIIAHFRQLSSTLSAEQRKCAESIVQSIEPRR